MFWDFMQIMGSRMDHKRVVRMAELEIDPAHLDDYRRLLIEEIEASVRLEDGVLALNAVALKDSPEKIRISRFTAMVKPMRHISRRRIF